jgi:predicted nucleic acid-binding protein
VVTALVDTSVIVDLLRGYAPAREWFLQQNDLAVARPVWLEVIEGAPNRSAQRFALNLLRRFEVIELVEPDAIWAVDKLLAYNLSHGVDAFDCLIGAISQRKQIPLYTHSLKHFTRLLASLAIKPY